MEEISGNLIFAIGKYQNLDNRLPGSKEPFNRDAAKERFDAEIKSVVEYWPNESRTKNTKRLAKALEQTKHIPPDPRVRAGDKLVKINEMLMRPLSRQEKVHQNPTTILDVGAGDGLVLSAMIDHFQKLTNTTVRGFAIEPKLTATNVNFTLLDNYSSISDDSIDLITVLETFHHINPTDRDEILSELYRIMTPGGRLIIAEHDNPDTTAFYAAIDIYHNYWYIIEKEDYDPLHLMSMCECTQMLSKAGFNSLLNPELESWQRIYWGMFTKLPN